LHNRPERIPGAVAKKIRRARADGYDRIFVAYADCGTGGLLDRVLETEGVARLEGAHCYEVYAGRAAFAALSGAEPGTFYLTDFLARNFERLVIHGLGLDHHPFGSYRRLVYLAPDGDDISQRRRRRAPRAGSPSATVGLASSRRDAAFGRAPDGLDDHDLRRIHGDGPGSARSAQDPSTSGRRRQGGHESKRATSYVDEMRRST
jgi:hypothetical protein